MTAIAQKNDQLEAFQLPRQRPTNGPPLELAEHARARILDLTKAALWREFEIWTRPRRAIVERQVRSFFRQQQAEIVQNVEAGKAAFVKGVNEWLDWPKWLVTFEEFGQLFLPEVMGDYGQVELEKILIGATFDVERPQVLAFIERRSFQFSFDTNAGTRKKLTEAFTQSLLEGEGVPQLTRRINDIFTFKKRHQAEQIARSEVIRAANAGAEEAYLQSGVVTEKEWIVSRDLRLCPYCEPMAGRRVVVGFAYFQQGDVLQNPDFPNQSLTLDYENIFAPPLHVQCRCTLAPVITL